MTVEFYQFKNIPFKSNSFQENRYISFNQSGTFRRYQVLDGLYKEHHIFIINVFSYKDHFTYTVRFCIKMRVEITEIWLILFDDGFQLKIYWEQNLAKGVLIGKKSGRKRIPKK